MGVGSTRTNSDAYLDGLRAIAVLAVVALHSRPAVRTPDDFQLLGIDVEFVFASSYMGVDLFFVLSGFLLARPWFTAELTGKPRPDLPTFWRRRLARIVPGYYFSIIATVFFFAGTTIPLETLRGWLGARILGAHALFVHNYIPVTSTGLNFANVGWWTLTVEMTWYLLLPLFSLACLGGRWRIALPLVVAATAVWILVVRNGMDHTIATIAGWSDPNELRLVGIGTPIEHYVRFDILLTAFPSFAATFLFGVLLAKLWAIARAREPGSPVPVWQRPQVATAACGLALAGLVATAAWAFRAHIEQPLARPLYGLFLAVIVYGVCFGYPVLRRPLECLPLRFIGWVSFGVYLFNLPVSAVVSSKLDLSGLGRWTQFAGYFAATTAVSVAAATVSWLFVERAFLARTTPVVRTWRDRVLHPSRRAAAVGLAVAAAATYALVIR